ncbi:MAG TPA: hypothetical protein VIY86_13465, partial [Pirellulaceae bacterium]
AFIRAGWDMWRCRWGLTCLVVSGGSYVAAALAQLGRWRVNDPLLNVMAIFGLFQLGHALLMMSFLFYARHVYLSAQGRLGVKRAAKDSSSKRTATGSDGGDQAEEGSDSTSHDEYTSTRSGAAGSGATHSGNRHGGADQGGYGTSRKDLKKQQRRAA